MLSPSRLATLTTSAETIDLETYTRFVESVDYATIFHQPCWIRLLRDYYRLPLHIPAIVCNGRIQAAIPLLQTRGIRGDRRLISLPYSDAVPPLCLDESSGKMLLDYIRERYIGENQKVIIRSSLPAGYGQVVSEEGNWLRHIVDFRESPEQDFSARYSRSLRTNLRRARKLGLQVCVSTDQSAVRTFYRMHVQTRRKLGVPVQTEEFFIQLHERIIAAGSGVVLLVQRAGEPIAGGVILYWNRHAVFKYAAANPRRLEYRPNDILFHEALVHCRNMGMDQVDFGVTPSNQPGLCRFKRKFGAKESPMHHQLICGMPSRSISDSVLVKAVRPMIRHSPSFVCRLLGKWFYRYSQ